MPTFFDALAELSGADNDGLEEVLSELRLGLFIDHPEKGCIYCNAEVLRMFEMEWEEFQGYGWAKVVLPEDMEALRVAIERYEIEKGTIDVHYRIDLPSGVRRALHVVGRAVLDADGNQLGSIMVGRDVTVERLDREDAAQRHKLEAIGRLAGRLAHDFNNALTPIVFSVAELEHDTSLSRVARSHVDMIASEVTHLTEMTRQLLSLSRKGSIQAGACALDKGVAAKEGLLMQLAGERIQLVFDLQAAGLYVALAGHEVGQILLNLVLNARDAIQGAGRVTIESRKQDELAVLTITDTGAGIPPEIVDRVFEPFYTTKPAERGSGLGLFSVREAVERAGGHARVESTVGVGTRFVLSLPCVAQTASEAREAVEAPELPPLRVLITEDNAALRQTLAFVLALRGHTVEISAGLERAAELLQAESYDALVTDVLLADGSGVDLAAAARHLVPDLPVVFMSGFAGDQQERMDLDSPNTTFLLKPFPVNRLLWALADVLDA